MNGFSLGRMGIFGTLLLAAVLGAAVVASRVGPAPAPTAVPEPISAIESCHLPDTDVKGGGTLSFRWQLAVRLDSPQESALLFTSGSDRLTCETWRGADGNFGSSTITSVGRFEPQSRAALTYDGGSEPAPGESWSSQLVIGRAPHAAASIEVVTADGDRHHATIGNGLFLAWVTTGDGQSKVVEIAARDYTGRIIARLVDPSGLQPGASDAPASS